MLRHRSSMAETERRTRCAGSTRVVTAGLAATLFISATLIAGCGGTNTRPRPAVCSEKAQQAVAHDLGAGMSTIDYAKSIASNGMPQCEFAGRAGGHRVLVTVNVDNGPQAYFRLLRTVAEATQIFGPKPPDFHPPQGLSGLGPYASWFPNNHQLMATNAVDLFTVTVSWSTATRNMEIAAARAALVPYLRAPHGKGNTIDYSR